MGPINYGVDVPDPTRAFADAFSVGASISDMRAKQELAAQQANRQAVINQGFERLRQPGATAKDYADLAMLLPEPQAKSVRESFGMINADQQQSALTQAGQVFSALKAGRPEVAVGLIDRQIEAKRNSGDEAGAKFLETWRDVSKENPKAAEDYFGFTLSQIPGGDKVLEGAIKLGGERRAAEKAPFELSEAQSKAATAAVKAKFAESEAVVDLEKKGWDVKKIQEDIKIAKQNASIAALNAQIAREGNQIKREENQIKLRELIDKRDTAVREKAGELESARADMDNFLNTTTRILQTPMNVVGSAAGPISARMPTLSQDTADFEALVETLGSQAFMAQIPKMKGTGALSEGEGKKLQASLQNLSLSQSPERLMENVKEAQRLILKARENLANKAGVPNTAPDAPAATSAAPKAAISVTAPNGQVISFPSQAAADEFKKAAGVR